MAVGSDGCEEGAMRHLWIASVLMLGIGIGCVAATVAQNFVVPPARAGTNPMRWEYTCFKGYVWGVGPLDPDGRAGEGEAAR